MVPDPCISIVVAAAEEVTAAAETARAAKKRQKERKRRTRRANKGVKVIVFPPPPSPSPLLLIKSRDPLLVAPPDAKSPNGAKKVQKERERETKSLARSFVRFKKRPPGIYRVSSQISRTVQFRSATKGARGRFCEGEKKKRVQKTTRPVLTFAQYDTLNYTTPLKRLVREVSYLGNVRLVREKRRKVVSSASLLRLSPSAKSALLRKKESRAL